MILIIDAYTSNNKKKMNEKMHMHQKKIKNNLINNFYIIIKLVKLNN